MNTPIVDLQSSIEVIISSISYIIASDVDMFFSKPILAFVQYLFVINKLHHPVVVDLFYNF